MIVIKNVRVDERGEALFEKVNLVIQPGERVAVTGSNTGIVTVFLQTLSGDIEMDEGTVRTEGARLLYLSLDALRKDQEILLQITQTRPDFLLIDTGASVIDPDLQTRFIEMIQSFRGGILIASSDTALIRAARTTKVLEVNSAMKTVISYSGTYDTYLLEREKRDSQLNEAYEKQQREKRRLETWLEQKRKEASVNRSPERGATIRAKVKYLQREILDKEIPNPRSQQEPET